MLFHGHSHGDGGICLGKDTKSHIVVEKNVVSKEEKSVTGLLSEAKSLRTVAEGLGPGGGVRGVAGGQKAREHLISRARAKPRCLLLQDKT